MSDYTTHKCPECGDVHLPPSKDTIDHSGHNLGDLQIEGGDKRRWCFDCEAWLSA